VTPLLDARTGVDLRFDAAMLPTWRLDHPAALRLDPVASALRVDALASQGRLAELPVRWDGGPLAIEVDLEVERAEYNSALHFALVDEAGRVLLGIGVRGVGDRKLHEHGVTCLPVGQHGYFAERQVPSAVTRHRVVLRATLFPDRGMIECTADDDGQRTYKPSYLATRPSAGPYTLVIGNTAPHTKNRVVAEIRRITLRGARLDDVAVDASPAAAIARALVASDTAAALAALAVAPPEDPRHALLALLIHDALGRPAAPEVLGLALSDLADADLLHLLRTRPALAPALRASAETRVQALLASTWSSLARHHVDDPALQRELLAALDGIETIAVDDVNRRAVGTLLHARAQIHRQLGRRAHARRDYEGALVAFGDTPDPPGEPLRAAIHLALASMLVESDADSALAHLTRAVACDEAPELALDRLRREPRILARAAADPAWSRALLTVPAYATCSGPADP
jgi:tetratricopeptide (TPR) repeat protein